MAIDNTPPRLKLIVTIAIITVVTLVSLDFVFKSYYAMMSDEAQREKVAPQNDKIALHKAEAAAFAAAAVPMDKVIADLAKGARPEAITPQPSEDIAPMTGWSKLPKPAPVPQPKGQIVEPAVAGDGGAPLMTGDAGALHLAGDAGVHSTPTGAHPAAPTGDAGAAKPAPTPHH